MKLGLCISSEDDRIYRAAGITNVKYISGNICPDHYFADSISDIFQWGLRENLDLLITKTLVSAADVRLISGIFRQSVSLTVFPASPLRRKSVRCSAMRISLP